MMKTRVRPRVNARGRILGWFLVIVAAALLLTLVLVSESLFAVSRQAVSEELEHEIAKFRAYASQAMNQATGDAYDDPADLLRDYLAGAVTEPQEGMFSVVDGRPGFRTRNEISIRLDKDPAVIADAAAATSQVTRTIMTPQGSVVYSVIPVVSPNSDTRAALVVVEMLGPGEREVVRTIQLIGALSALSLAIAGVISWLVAGRVLAPIRKVRQAAEATGGGDLSARISIDASRPNDDVTRLASAFNRMLDRLEQAFDAQRQFLNDAAHELRTPLTVIRGHLELPEAGRGQDQQQLILGEVDRMDRILGDLLVLAKAKRPDFLFKERVDLTDLVVSVAAKARLLADRDWGVPVVAECLVTADGQRLTQALMQLISNAIAVTAPGEAINISSVFRDDGVELLVEDSGPGIAESDRDLVFHRFQKGAGSQSTGLGLAIVVSIARAHGGSAEVRDSALGGAAVGIWLPGDAVGLVRTDLADEEEEGSEWTES